MESIIQIRKNVFEKTTECRKNFQCISTKLRDLCRVELLVNTNSIVIKCRSSEYCNYKESEESSVCLCPTRKEINLRYRL